MISGTQLLTGNFSKDFVGCKHVFSLRKKMRFSPPDQNHSSELNADHTLLS